MKKRIIEFVFALLIAVFIAFRYINAIWPDTIPCIDGLTTFLLVTFLGFLWLMLYPDKDKLRFYALIILACICFVTIPTTAIDIHFEKKDRTIRLGYVLYKNKSGNTKGGRVTPDGISVIINDSLETYLYVSNKTIKNINVGDTITSRVSSRGHIDYKNLFPTHEEIEFYRVPQHYIDGELQAKPPVEQYPAAVRDSALRQSHKQLGFVYEKIDDDYYRHFLRVGIADSLTTLHEFYETDRLYAKAYKRIGVGDTVIVRTADAMPQINQVVNWRPTPSEIQKCRIPAPYTASATQNYTQAFIDSVMQQSHEQLGFVFDKYEDEHVGAYLEVGVSDSLTRTYRFYKYKKPYTNIFKTISIGDTVTLRVSDDYPQINKVIMWNYAQAEKPTDKESSSDKLEGVTDKEIEDEILDADFAIVYTKGINSVWPKYFVKLKYNNTVSDYIGIDDIYKKQIYESISAGDTVIIQKPKNNSEKLQVLLWKPTPEEIEQYRTQVRKTENN